LVAADLLSFSMYPGKGQHGGVDTESFGQNRPLGKRHRNPAFNQSAVYFGAGSRAFEPLLPAGPLCTLVRKEPKLPKALAELVVGRVWGSNSVAVGVTIRDSLKPESSKKDSGFVVSPKVVQVVVCCAVGILPRGSRSKGGWASIALYLVNYCLLSVR